MKFYQCSSHKKTSHHYSSILEIGFLARKIRGIGPIPREEYSSRGIGPIPRIFLTRKIPREENSSRGIGPISSYFPCVVSYSRGIFLARKFCARFSADPHIFLVRIIVSPNEKHSLLGIFLAFPRKIPHKK